MSVQSIDEELDRMEAERVPVRKPPKGKMYGAGVDRTRGVKKSAWIRRMSVEMREIEIELGVKTCARCKQSKKLCDFSTTGNTGSTLEGRDSYCLQCRREQHAARKAQTA